MKDVAVFSMSEKVDRVPLGDIDIQYAMYLRFGKILVSIITSETLRELVVDAKLFDSINAAEGVIMVLSVLFSTEIQYTIA